MSKLFKFLIPFILIPTLAFANTKVPAKDISVSGFSGSLNNITDVQSSLNALDQGNWSGSVSMKQGLYAWENNMLSDSPAIDSVNGWLGFTQAWGGTQHTLSFNLGKLYKVNINNTGGYGTETFDWYNLKFPTLTTNGFLKTGSSNGTLSVSASAQSSDINWTDIHNITTSNVNWSNFVVPNVNVNWSAIGFIQQSGMNWSSLNGGVLNSSGINWTDINKFSTINSKGINWSNINILAPVQSGGINWPSCSNIIPTTAISWNTSINSINVGSGTFNSVNASSGSFNSGSFNGSVSGNFAITESENTPGAGHGYIVWTDSTNTSGSLYESTTGLKYDASNQLITTGVMALTTEKISATTSSVNGSSSGNVIFSQPEQGPTYKKVIAKVNGLSGTASYNFPTSFVATPVVLSTNGLATTKVTGLSNNQTTITGSANDTGFIIIEGY